MADLLRLYHKSPYPVRAIAASLRGYSLRRWRYGEETQALVEQAQERESWSEGRWGGWRDERLAYVLGRAAQEAPYYREQ